MNAIALQSRALVFALVFALCSAASNKCPAWGDTLQPVVDEIRFEACLPDQNDWGYPLPLAAHWNTGELKDGFSPKYQMEMVKKGHFLLPWFQLPDPYSTPLDSDYYEAAIKWAAKEGLPISFLSTQCERYLTDSPEYFSLPTDRNPNVVNWKLSIEKKVSPFGPVGPWEDLGRKWGSTQTLRKIQRLYPAPPLVLFISNNEHAKLTWNDSEDSSRYLKEFGPGKDNDFKRKVVGDGWIERYRALQKGIVEGLDVRAWKQSSRFIGYDAFGPSAFGRSGGWIKYSLYIPGRLEPWLLAWDGGSAPYYVNWDVTTDYTVQSPQIESMNWVFMLREARRLNQEFWFEISAWDGHQEGKHIDLGKYFADRGQVYDPKRYQGMVQFGMWLLRPRVVREFRLYNDTLAKSEPYFLSIVNSVDRVHTNPILRRFWRKGQLVANPNGSHPYESAIPEEYKKAIRWFLLDANVNPKGFRFLSTEVPVFSLALVLGEAPEREWLVYTHSPLKNMDKVEISLPDYGSVQLDVTPAGCFCHVIEKDKSMEKLPE
ncbi:MAG: hypothetical protein ACLQVJ_29430 [Syntrophobacteraceae bacterium]